MTMPQPTPVSVTGEQCNERARVVFYQTLGLVGKELEKEVINLEKLHALAAVCEACGNDLDAASPE